MNDDERDALKDFIIGLVRAQYAEMPRPERGEKGEPGEKGMDGAIGPEGTPGANGKDGLPGADGTKGMDGKDGRDGRDGKDGITERQMDEAVALALAKALPAAVDAAVGETITKMLEANPILTFKGVYKAGIEYAAGQVVQYGGDMYHCNTATSEKPDAHFGTGKPGAWTLAVKKGRDGRDR